MLICRYVGGHGPQYGTIADDVVHRLDGDPFTEPKVGDAIGPVADVDLVAPVAPTKIIGVGPNYRGMADELLFAHPRIFGRAPNTVVGPGDAVLMPEGVTSLLYEGELGVVIGRRATDIPKSAVYEYIFGYVLGNDVTALEAMEADGGELCRAKGYDSFYPCGPWINTEIDPDTVVVHAAKNGVHQTGMPTTNMAHDIPTLVSFISGVMTLEPGDVITTGCAPTVYGEMVEGDEVYVEADGLGRLHNRVVRREQHS